MELRPGQRLRGTSGVEVVVIRAGAGPCRLACGGAALVDVALAEPDLPPAADGETLLGKRYVDDVTGLELLCTKGGAGTLVVDGRALRPKDTTPLPSSD